MTNEGLAADYLERVGHRLAAVELLFQRGAYADVVREAQELVELALKAFLRLSRVDPPHVHDVGQLLLTHRDRLPSEVRDDVDRLADISHRLRRDRELAFYGSEDLTPGTFYRRRDAEKALSDAQHVARLAEVVRAGAVDPG